MPNFFFIFFRSRQQSGGGKSLHLHKQLAALVYRNTESGYSLLGGKWLPEKDGFMPGSGNENPNLIAAAIRLVHEQTGLNLSSCRQWKVFATFVYNRSVTICSVLFGGFI